MLSNKARKTYLKLDVAAAAAWVALEATKAWQKSASAALHAEVAARLAVEAAVKARTQAAVAEQEAAFWVRILAPAPGRPAAAASARAREQAARVADEGARA